MAAVFLRRPALRVLLACCAAITTEIHAGEPLSLITGRTQVFDSNLFRIPASADPAKVLGKPQHESIGINTLGLSIDQAYSLQQFKLDLNLLDYQYQNFRYLSYVARNLDTSWAWSLTPQFHGQLSGTRKESLDQNTLMESLGLKNQQIDKTTSFDANYQLDGVWRLTAGAAHRSKKSDYAIVGESDFDTNEAKAGFHYSAGAGDNMFFTLTKGGGTYINHIASGVDAIGDHDLTEYQVGRSWHISGKSTADLRLSHRGVSHPSDHKRDFGGVKSDFKVQWAPTGKVVVLLNWARKLSSYQTYNTNYAQTDSFSVEPVWRISPKTVIRLQHQTNLIRYLGSPSAQFSNTRRDTTQSTTIAVDWHPTNYLTLNASLQLATRASNIVDYDYKSHIATVLANIRF